MCALFSPSPSSHDRPMSTDQRLDVAELELDLDVHGSGRVVDGSHVRRVTRLVEQEVVQLQLVSMANCATCKR